jgi:poly-beta-1,6-N-acetyl-D-glucosamine biosynthesis protein PgaD
MKEIIIDQPHLQSLQQKLGSLFLSAMSWLLWLYFLAPLLTLAGWLMGAKSLSDEIRWFGGYKTLLQLLQMYGEIILLIAALWLAWTFFITWLHTAHPGKTPEAVGDGELAQRFELQISQLAEARQAQKLTVHFDEHAGIVAIE